MSASASNGLAATTVRAEEPNHVVIYDGVCNFCDVTVKFLIQRDSKKVLRFCALQSKAAEPLMERYHFTRDDALKSICFIENGECYQRSEAFFYIVGHLDWPWPALQVLACFPTIIRDTVYGIISSNRYRIFGKNDECLMPRRDIIERFLDKDELRGPGKKTK